MDVEKGLPQGAIYDGLEATRSPYKRHVRKIETIARMAAVEAGRLRESRWIEAARAVETAAYNLAIAAGQLEDLASGSLVVVKRRKG